MTVPKKTICDSVAVRHSAAHRIELVKKRFAPRSEKNSQQISFHQHRADQPKQEIQHTLGHIRCSACAAAGKKAMRAAINPGSDFNGAASEWLENHRHHISARTAIDYEQYIDVLKKFGLTNTPIQAIDIGTFAAYQDWRADNPKRGAGNPRINQELNCLAQILEQAGLWKDIKPYYKPLRLPKWKPPRVMTPAKEDEVLQIAASSINWEVAHCSLVITNNTAIGPGELRAIQVGHLQLENNIVHVAAGDLGDKNEFRIAPMALNKAARGAFEILLARYFAVLGRQGIEYSDEHFLVPFRVKKGTYDPRRQASPSFIRSALREIRVEAGMPRLRHYDFRHQCLTTLLEIPEISEETVQAVARHRIGTRTIEHYSAIRIEKKQVAVDALEHLRGRRSKIISQR
jgi:integrase